jgi:hypothetical protein
MGEMEQDLRKLRAYFLENPSKFIGVIQKYLKDLVVSKNV